MGESARFYGLTALFDTAALNTDKSLVMQYEVALTKGLTCGGAYLKFLDANAIENAEDMNDESPFIIMFGPDKCGSTNKVHFIIRHQNPVNNEWVEHHLNNPPSVPTLVSKYCIIMF